MSEPTAQDNYDAHLAAKDAALAAMTAERDAAKGELKSIAFTYCGVNTDDPTDFQGELTTGMVYAFLEGRFESLTAELDAVQKERDALQRFKSWVHNYLDQHDVPHHPPGTHGAEGCRIGDRMDWLTSKLDTAQARCVELERAIQEAPHGPRCLSKHSLIGEYKPDEPSACDCWKSRISPDQKPALKGGDAGVFIETPPMTGAADVQSESRPSPDHGKAGEWLPIEISKPAPCIVVLGFSADWIDFDYNPAGIRECFMDDMEIWLSPKWNNYQDVYENDFEAPTHWQPLLAPPTPGAKQSEEGA